MCYFNYEYFCKFNLCIKFIILKAGLDIVIENDNWLELIATCLVTSIPQAMIEATRLIAAISLIKYLF